MNNICITHHLIATNPLQDACHRYSPGLPGRSRQLMSDCRQRVLAFPRLLADQLLDIQHL